MKNALLIEDHDQTRDWMKEVLLEAFPGIAIHCAASVAEAQALLEQSVFSVALVDINLPDGSGLSLVPEMSQANRVGYIVMSTIFDDDDNLFNAIQAGAHGYLLKDQPKDQLVSKLAGIMRGDPPLSPGIARRLLSFYRQSIPLPVAGNEKPKDKPPNVLSKREEEAITLIAKGLTVKEMAGMLDITPNTASGYVKSAYRKLNVSSRAEASLKAVELGLVNSSSE